MAFSYWMRSYDEPIFHLNQCNRSNNNISYGVTHVTSQSMKNCPIEKAAETNLLLHKNSYCIKMQQIIMKKKQQQKRNMVHLIAQKTRTIAVRRISV